MIIAAMGVAARGIAQTEYFSIIVAGTTDMTDDEFLEALTVLEDVLADNGRRASLIKKRIAQLRRLRARDVPYAELVGNEHGPLIVHLLTESSAALDTAGANVRRAEAEALYAEGMTMEEIAEIFGVTRQRVSALLRKGSQDPQPGM
jgi:DNA-directed RNA polymerase specialized sigma24 family protein